MPLSSPIDSAFLSQLELTFLEARKLVLPYFKSANLNVENKADTSPVTQADKELNTFFIRELKNLLPNSVLIGEEEDSDFQLEESLAANVPCWVLDPLDGTREFINGTDEWAMMLALYVPNTGIVLSVVYQPTTQDYYWALAGKGAYCKNLVSQNVSRLNASSRSKPSESIMLISKSREDAWVSRLCSQVLFGEKKPRGSIGLKAVDIASSRADLYLNGESKCGPWDLMPCLLFLSESGASFWSSKPIDWNEHLKSKTFSIPFAFSNSQLWKNVELSVSQSLRTEVKTTSGLSPSDFFASPRSAQGRLRAVFTIGISGSGKSHWADIAAAQNWKLLQSDTLRVEWLKEAQLKGEELVLAGNLSMPNPRDTTHIFCSELRDKVMDLDFLVSQVNPDQAVVFDITNLTLQRVPFMQQMLARGYDVEALVFEPNSLDVHVKNVNGRSEQRGGLYVAPTIVADLLSTFNVFCRDLKVASNLDVTLDPKTLNVNFKKMRQNYNSYAHYLESLDDKERSQVEKLKALDTFSRVDYVPVESYF